MSPIQELRKLIDEWGQRLEDLGPRLVALRDDPESFTKDETMEVLKEAEVVFSAWNTIQYGLSLDVSNKTIQ